jgi:type II restriction enzyme
MKLDLSHPVYRQRAKVYRVGVTNAADRGLDMYSNWGPAIQIKHLRLDEDLANTIVGEIQSDRIVIVCKEVDSKVLVSVLNQIGWASKIQSVVTEEDLKVWYEKALRGQYAEQMGQILLDTFAEQMQLEFPSVGGGSKIIDSRNYQSITDPMWRL